MKMVQDFKLSNEWYPSHYFINLFIYVYIYMEPHQKKKIV